MITKISQLLAALLCTVASVSCSPSGASIIGSDPSALGPMVKQSRQSAPVTAIDAGRGVTVVYTQSDQLSLEVEAPDSVIDHITTTISKGKLTATVDNKIRNVNFKVIVRVSAPLVTDFDISSGAAVEVAALNAASQEVEIEVSSGASASFSALTASAVSVDASSGASASVAGIRAEAVDAEASSGASISLSGNATSGDFDVSSGASIAAGSLTLQSADAEASSGGSLTCHAASMKRSKATSGGSINNK